MGTSPRGGGEDIQRAALVSDGRGRGGMVNSVWSPELNVVGVKEGEICHTHQKCL